MSGLMTGRGSRAQIEASDSALISFAEFARYAVPAKSLKAISLRNSANLVNRA